VFRYSHLAAVGIVVGQAWLGRICPLTTWENALRRRAGQSSYEETFIQHWLHPLLFYAAPAWVFTAIYSIFGVLVALVWWRAAYRSRVGRR
jgi:polyferredoxin